jgi:hypothetical protein
VENEVQKLSGFEGYVYGAFDREGERQPFWMSKEDD